MNCGQICGKFLRFIFSSRDLHCQCNYDNSYSLLRSSSQIKKLPCLQHLISFVFSTYKPAVRINHDNKMTITTGCNYCCIQNSPASGTTKRITAFGEPGWDRTIDPLIKSQMLYPWATGPNQYAENRYLTLARQLADLLYQKRDKFGPKITYLLGDTRISYALILYCFYLHK